MEREEVVDRWEQVWQGTSEATAEIVAGRLESEGIRSAVRGHSFQERTMPFAFKGAWAVYVPASGANLARDYLRASGEAANVIDAEPASGLTPGQVSTIRFVIIGALVIAIAGAVLAVRGS